MPSTRFLTIRRSILAAVALATACGSSQEQQGTTAKPQQSKNLGTPSTGYDFAHDGAGRLITVLTPAGNGAHYTYDPAGNLLSIERYAPGAFAIVGFSPTQGTVGQVVTVDGIGFSAVASENVVKLNGTSSTVLSSTSAQLTFAVPSGATSGQISVTVGTTTATSTGIFTVTTSPVNISSFSPTIGKVGTSVSITGQGFATNLLDNAVLFGSKEAVVATATSTALQVSVPNFATTGKITVETPAGSATTASDFWVVPGPYATTDIVSQARTTIGTTNTVTIGTAGKIGLLAFDAVVGQAITLYVTGVTLPGSTTIEVWTPAGVSILSTTAANGSTSKLDAGFLTASGVYTVVVKAASGSTGNVNIQILSDATVALQVDGAAASLTLNTGQNGLFRFAALASDLLGLGVSQLNTTATISVLNPDGSTWQTCPSMSSPSNCQLSALPSSGTYSVRVIPAGVAAATVTILLSRPLTGALAGNGTLLTHSSSRVGQQGRYTFSGTAGQNLTLRVTGYTYSSYFYSYIYRPDGSQLLSVGINPNSDQKVDLGTLSQTGTYLLTTVPNGITTGTIDFRLWPEVTGTLVTDGPSAAITLNSGQNGRYTFSGSTSEVVGFGVTASSTLTPSNATVDYKFLNPDGSTLQTCTFPGAGRVNCLFSLPQTGTYTIRVVPSGTASANLTVLLSHLLTGTFTTDGTLFRHQPTRAGQSGRYTFSATAGQNLTLRVTGAGPNGANPTNVTIYRPDWVTAFSGDFNPGNGGDLKVDLSNCQAGTYVVYVVPGGSNVSEVDFSLWREVSGSLVIGGAAVPMTINAGQNGRYTFTGAAGDLLTLTLTQFSTTPPTGVSVYFQAFNPDGSVLGDWTTWGANPWQLPTLPAAGTYAIRVIPSGTAAANVTAQLTRR